MELCISRIYVDFPIYLVLRSRGYPRVEYLIMGPCETMIFVEGSNLILCLMYGLESECNSTLKAFRQSAISTFAALPVNPDHITAHK